MAQKRKSSQDNAGAKRASSIRVGTRTETESRRQKPTVRANKDKKKSVKQGVPPATAQAKNEKPNAGTVGDGRSVRVHPVSLTSGDKNALPVQDSSSEKVLNAVCSSVEGQLAGNTVKDYDCAVCLDTSGHRRIKYLPCFHKYHKACVDTWLNLRRVCPICRTLA